MSFKRFALVAAAFTPAFLLSKKLSVSYLTAGLIQVMGLATVYVVFFALPRWVTSVTSRAWDKLVEEILEN